MNLKNGDKFYNYAKKSIITLELQPCRLCNFDAIAIVEDREEIDILSYMFTGHGRIECTNPNCSACTRDYNTDTNWSRNLGVEKAQNDWNNGIYAE